MTISLKKRFSSALAFFLAAAVLNGCNQRQTLRIGDTIEPVVLQDVHGKSMTLPDDVKGKVALLRFWSIECPSCSKELIRAFDTLYRKYKAQGVVVVAINVRQPAEAAEEFKKLENISYPMLIDPNSSVARRFGVVGLPTTFILDQEGILREKITGDAELETFEKLLTTVLYKGGTYDSAY